MPKDSKPPAFPFYVDDFASDGKVEAMTTEEVGAYILLLCKAWREDPAGSLPADDRILSRWARLDSVRWHECKLAVLSTFDLRADGRLYQKRMEREARKMKENRRKRKVAASAAATKRWNDAKRMRTASQSHENRNANSCLSISSSTSISSSSKEEKETKEAASPARTKFNAADAVIPDSLNAQAFADAWKRWCRHRADIKKPLTATSVDQQFRQFSGWGVDRAVKAIEFTILKGWQGIREDDSGTARAAGPVFSSGPSEARQSELERRRAAQRARLGIETEGDQ